MKSSNNDIRMQVEKLEFSLKTPFHHHNADTSSKDNDNIYTND